jgi:internalin A
LWANKNNIDKFYYPNSAERLISEGRLNLCQKNLTEFPEWTIYLTSLTELHLSNNQLTELPESIGNLTSLTGLRLHNNQLTELPESVGNLTNLTNLDIAGNPLKKLPKSIGNLINLEYLHICNECYISELPNTINQCVKLKNLDKIKIIIESNKWHKVLKENSADSFNSYIQTYPNGVHIIEATQLYKLRTSKVRKLFRDVFT